MHFPRVALGALLTAGLMALACSEEDTIVAVNVSSSKDVGYVTLLRVTITQSGQTPVQAEFGPGNTVDVEAGAGGDKAITASVDYRITLPSGWGEGKTTVELESVNAQGQNDLAGKPQTIDLKPEETTAVFFDLKREVEMPPAGGAGGAGGGGGMGGGGTGGTGGAQAGSGGAEAGNGGASAGAGGTDAAGTAGTGGS
jgi:hypothetical protein